MSGAELIEVTVNCQGMGPELVSKEKEKQRERENETSPALSVFTGSPLLLSNLQGPSMLHEYH